MWNTPTQKDLQSIPRLYQVENTAAPDKIIYMHFFIGACDWYVAEFDGEDTFFGYAILNGDYENAEWGYFSLTELRSISVHGIEVDRNKHWKLKKFSEIPHTGGRHAR